MRRLKRMNLIGMQIRVKYSSNVNLEGIKGVVIDETRNMLLLRKANGKVVKIPKDTCVFELNIAGRKCFVDGSGLIGRLEKRVVEG